MYRKMFLLLYLLLGVRFTYGTTIISGRLLNNTKYAVIVLEQFDIGSFSIAKTEVDKETGAFELHLPKDPPPGIYRLRYSLTDELAYIDMVLDGEKKLGVEIDVLNRSKQPIFSNSSENTAWYSYQYAINIYEQKITLLTSFINNYPCKEEQIIATALKTRLEHISSAENKRNKYIKENPGKLSAKMVANKPFYFPDPDEAYALQVYKRWAGYWNEINCSDSILLCTPLYTEHIIAYMRYWVDDKMHFNLLEQTEGFKRSIDTVMKVFGKNPFLQRFAFNYLVFGFKEIGQEEAVQYLEEYYGLQDHCNNDDSQYGLRRENTLVGKAAPLIYYTTTKGVEQEIISNATSDKIIVAFWASWCPHCRDAMPLLDDFVAKQKSVYALAVSLDTNAYDYKLVAGQLTHLTHYCDYLKWKSPLVSDYGVMATPTFFLIDKMHTVIGIYTSVEGLIVDFNKKGE